MDGSGSRTFSGSVLRIAVETPDALSEAMVLALEDQGDIDWLVGRFDRGAKSRGGRAWILDVGAFEGALKDEASVLYARPLAAGESWALEQEGLEVLDAEWPEPGRVQQLEVLRAREAVGSADPWLDPQVAARVIAAWGVTGTHAYLLAVPVGVGQLPSEQIRAGMDRLASTVGPLRGATRPWFNPQWEQVVNGVTLYWRRVHPTRTHPRE